MQHLAFIKHLAAIDEGSADWTTASLAFRALTLIDEHATAPVGTCAAAVSALLGDTRAADSSDSITEQVAAVADVLARSDLDHPSATLAKATLALTTYFRRSGLYELARDAARTALRHAPRNSDEEWISHRECGCAEWRLGNGEESDAHYSACIEIGQRIGSSDAVFWGRNGLYLHVRCRGNLPRAETLYRRLVDWGRRIERSDIEAHARHGLGITIGLRGRVREGLGHLELALPASTEVERIRVLTNIAYMRLQLGEHEPARDAFLEIARVATDRYEANQAHVNLIEVYAAVGARDRVQEHRRFLENQRLPSATSVDFQMTLGRAYLTLGDPTSAIPCFRRARALARRTGLGRDLIEADGALERLAGDRRHAQLLAEGVSTCERDTATNGHRLSARLQQ
jgi:tetratricopeptide (TPR) repeat protein